MPFSLVSQEKGIHHSFLCSVTSGSGHRLRKEGCHGGGVYSFFSWEGRLFQEFAQKRNANHAEQC